jgi:hypothetical protein
MANTCKLIASTKLTSTSGLITFSSIPQTYTDLEVRISARQFQENAGSPMYPRINSDSTTANYANVYWDFQSSPTTTAREASNYVSQLTDGLGVAGSYSYWRQYYPNYTNATKYKPYFFTVYYGKATGANTFTYANDGVAMRNNVEAITSLSFPAYNFATQYFAIGSLFQLYGISNS